MAINTLRRACEQGLNIFLALVIVTFSKNASAIIIDFDDAESKQEPKIPCGSVHLLSDEYKELLAYNGFVAVAKKKVVINMSPASVGK